MTETHPDRWATSGSVDEEDESPQSVRSVPSKEPYRFFQFCKDFVLVGLVKFSIQIHPAGGTAQTPSPAYHTPKVTSIKAKVYLPPSFSLYPGGHVERGGGAQAPSKEERVAKIRYHGWEGLFSLNVEITIFGQRETAGYLREGLDGQTVSADSAPNPRKVVIKRKGIGRTYAVHFDGYEARIGGDTLFWKGTKSELALIQDRTHSNNGNLKLISPNRPEKVLAVYQNRSDPTILGTLSVLEEFEEGAGGLLEEIITTCLAIVVAERLSRRSTIGGFWKPRGREE